MRAAIVLQRFRFGANIQRLNGDQIELPRNLIILVQEVHFLSDSDSDSEFLFLAHQSNV